jgi:hypothetical protein
MSKSKVKLFNELSDEQVYTQLSQWRSLGDKFLQYEYTIVTYNESSLEDVKKIERAVKTVLENEYENQRLELKRWRALYNRCRNYLLRTRPNACTAGKQSIDNAETLYNNGFLTTNRRLTIYGNVNLPSSLRGAELNQPGFQVFVQLPGQNEQVEVTNPSVIIL